MVTPTASPVFSKIMMCLTLEIGFELRCSPRPQIDNFFPLRDGKLGGQLGVLRAIQNDVALSPQMPGNHWDRDSTSYFSGRVQKGHQSRRHLRTALAMRRHHHPLLQQRMPP